MANDGVTGPRASPSTGKRVTFKTVGCRLNQAETAVMAARCEAAGYRVVPFGEPCDVCVIHTCTVTAKAERDCLRLARSARKRAGASIVALAGCAVEVNPEGLKEKSGADLVVGQDEKFRLPELLGSGEFCDRSGTDAREGPMEPAVLPSQLRACAGGSGKAPHPSALPLFTTTRALIKVQDGCDFRCHYCVVPRTRGASRSRPCSEIVDEVRALADRGYREAVLTGANLGSYRDGHLRLVDLLERVEAIQHLDRIRISSIEVSTTERAAIDYMAASGKLCRYIHLPLQSGDDRILAAMGRRYTVREYRALAEYAAVTVPLLGLGTDLVVGLPGEDGDAFENTFRVVADLPFSNLHVFPYSRRQGTRAASMPNQVDEHEKKRRAARLIELGRRKRRVFAERHLGREVSLLVEHVAPDGRGRGWTGEYVEAMPKRPGLAVNQIVGFVPSRCDGSVLS